jgi:hypothetical protein
MRTLYTASGFEGTGIFVRILGGILWEIRYFLFLLLVIMFGFAHSFFIFFHRDSGAADSDIQEDHAFADLVATIFTAYKMMLGEYPEEVISVGEHWVPKLYFVVFSFLITITLMNVLIAKMMDAYASINEHALGKYSVSRTTLVAEHERKFNFYLMRFKYFRSFFRTWIYFVQQGDQKATEQKVTSVGGPTLEYFETSLQQVNARMDRLDVSMNTALDLMREMHGTGRKDVEKAEKDKQKMPEQTWDPDLDAGSNKMNSDEIRSAVGRGVNDELGNIHEKIAKLMQADLQAMIEKSVSQAPLREASGSQGPRQAERSSPSIQSAGAPKAREGAAGPAAGALALAPPLQHPRPAL